MFISFLSLTWDPSSCANNNNKQQKERKEKCVVCSAVPNETDEAEASSGGLSVPGNPPVPALQLQ